MKSTGPVMRFFSNPVIAIVGSIASVIGLGLSAFLYTTGVTSRDLIYHVDPIKTAVARANQSSRISIQVDGEPVTRNVTAAQVAIWNDGKEPIREENLLGSGLLLVETGREHPIIDARVLEVSRDEVIKLVLDSSEIGIGRLSVKWAILEQQDAALLQLIYFGDDKTPITISAAVQKPSQVRAYAGGGLVNSVVNVVSVMITSLVWYLGTSYLFDYIWQKGSGRRLKDRVTKVVLSTFIFFLCVITMVKFRFWVTPELPFGL